MQKVLQALSIVSFIAAVSVIIGLSVTLYKGDPEIESFLNYPGILERLETSEQAETNAKILPPLVYQSIALSLRLNPPQMPKLDIQVNSFTETVIADNENKFPKTTKIIIPPPEQIKFKLVGTAVCIDRPDRSLALMELSNGKLEWFYQGEQLGRFYLNEIHNGRTIMTRGSETTELTVPPKPNIRKLLKDS